MHQYEITEVIKALDRAIENVPKDWDYISQDEEIASQVMELEYDCKALSDHLGVPRDLFPPLEQLEEDEVKLIVEKILLTWAAYHFIADLPEGLPVRIAYSTLLRVWDEIVPCCPFGSFHFDFYDQELDQYVQKPDIEYPF